MVLTNADITDGKVSINRVQEEVTYLRERLQESIKNIDEQKPPAGRMERIVYNKVGKEMAAKQRELLQYLDDGLKETFWPQPQATDSHDETTSH